MVGLFQFWGEALRLSGGGLYCGFGWWCFGSVDAGLLRGGCGWRLGVVWHRGVSLGRC